VTRTSHSSSTGWILGAGSHSGSLGQTAHGGTINSSGTTRWQERVPVIRRVYELRYQCKHCQARWTKERVHEEEDFDR
jgi:hypothetical protein